jgi:hypothetical protein
MNGQDMLQPKDDYGIILWVVRESNILLGGMLGFVVRAGGGQ